MRDSNDSNTLNNPLEIRCKCDDSRLPKYAHLGDVGADLRADIPGAIKIWPHESAWIDMGVCVEIPSGYVGLQFARSGLGMKHNVCLANGVGVINSGYRGRIRAKLINLGDKPYTVHPGDRVCQLVIVSFATIRNMQLHAGGRMMNFTDYIELEKRVEEHGIGEDPSLAQLLHIIQFKEVVKEGHKRTMNDLADWEKNIAETVEQRIKDAETSDDYR